MKIRTRIFVGFCAVAAVGVYFLVNWLIDDLKPQYRKATEEPLVDTARVLAHVAAATSVDGQLNIEVFRHVFGNISADVYEAVIYDHVKRSTDFRVYITDQHGYVVFDSDNGRDEGVDYSQWQDVHRTLEGRYGARTSNDLLGDPTTSVMYVSAPIVVNGEVRGVLSVGKPTTTANFFMTSTRKRIIFGGIVTLVTLMLVTALLSTMVTVPIKKLTVYAQAIRDRNRVPIPELGRSEIGELGRAFEEMREALDGKKYVEQYVQSLTHEIKAPLAALRGAVELLLEDMESADRDRFLRNIKSETQRIQGIVDNMLLLASLETRQGIREVEFIEIEPLVEDVVKSLEPMCVHKCIRIDRVHLGSSSFRGERFLVFHAVMNAVQNAIEFSNPDSVVHIETRVDESGVAFFVRDEGSGIPEYALSQVFHRFYSLKRPGTGKKSSGLGLSLVLEAAEIHGGSVAIRNRDPKGVEIEIRFPYVK